MTDENSDGESGGGGIPPDPQPKQIDFTDDGLPIQVTEWLTQVLQEDKTLAGSEAVLDVLTEFYSRKGRPWLQATAVLKKFGLLGDIKSIIERSQKELLANRDKRSRSNSHQDPLVEELQRDLDFEVLKVWVFTSSPPMYKMDIRIKDNGKEKSLSFPDEDIRKPHKFKDMFRCQLFMQPVGIPKKGDDWDVLVRHWMDRAEREGTQVPMPRESSTTGQICEIVRQTIWERMMVGETIDDLNAGRLVQHPTTSSRYVVKGSLLVDEVSKRYRERTGTGLSPGVLGQLLKDLLDFDLDDRVRLGSRQARVYSFDWALGETEPPPAPGTLLSKRADGDAQTSLLDLDQARRSTKKKPL